MKQLRAEIGHAGVKRIFDEPVTTFISTAEAPETTKIWRTPTRNKRDGNTGMTRLLGRERLDIPWRSLCSSIPEMCVYELRDVFMFGGVVFTGDGRFLADSAYFYRDNGIPDLCVFFDPYVHSYAVDDGWFIVPKPESFTVSTVEEPTFLYYFASEPFGHIIHDALTQLWALELVPELRDVRFFLMSNSKGLMSKAAQCAAPFGIREEQFITTRGITFFKTLYIATRSFVRGDPATLSPELTSFAYVAEQAHSTFDRIVDYYAPREAWRPENIYLSRRFNENRKLLNIDEVEDFFRKEGFSPVYMEKNSFVENIRITANAKRIISDVGSTWCSRCLTRGLEKALYLFPEGFNPRTYVDLPLLEASFGLSADYCYGRYEQSLYKNWDNSPWVMDMDNLRIAFQQWMTES